MFSVVGVYCEMVTRISKEAEYKWKLCPNCKNNRWVVYGSLAHPIKKYKCKCCGRVVVYDGY